MTITRLFTKTFDEVMKAKGFKRKNRLYFKLVGEILQGVVIKATNPFDICFAAIPYWIPKYHIDAFPLYKGYWAEGSLAISSNDYYRKDDEEYNSYYMNMCLEIAKQYIFPTFEAITDIESYLAANANFWQGRNSEEERLRFINIPVIPREGEMPGRGVSEFWRILNRETQYALLYNAYLSNSFEMAYDELKFILSRNPLYNTDERLIKYYSEIFVSQMEKGDYLWIENLKQARSAQMKARLRDELGLDTFSI